jgi:glutamate-ammonia-ligase adenylyltransferase
MPGEVDPSSADRVRDLAGATAFEQIEPMVHQSPNPGASMRNLERWLAASGSPGSIAQYLSESRTLAELVVSMLGASQYAADILIQNPELASLVLDPSEVSRPIDTERLLADGHRLLAGATGYAHRLDRLRFLQQGAMIRIVVADLGGIWTEPEVWRGLSDLADAMIILAAEVAWDDYARSRDLEGDCPISIAGMGKLGGRELNFSSDIDLVFILDDAADERMEVHASRFCEKLGRALSDRMSRGSLYRVDLRLRPFGRSGPIAPRMRAIEAYSDKYAEPWEHLALIRSRVIVGPPEIKERWERMREATVFKQHRGEWAVEQIVSMRQRLEDRSDDSDLKRGPGGIRDAEFSAQILQMLFGADRPSLRGAGTLDALVALQMEGLIPVEAARQLSEGYSFLRQVEHRCQLVDDKQTHRLPDDPAQRLFLSRRMGFSSQGAFESNLDMHRARIRHWYRELLSATPALDARERCREKLGSEWPEAALWLDHLSAPDQYWQSLAENESSLDRVQHLCRIAPAFVVDLRRSETLTEQVFSGEILEGLDASGVRRLKPDWDPVELAGRMRTAWVKACVAAAMEPSIDFGHAYSRLCEAVLERLRERTSPELTLVALGSLAGHSLLPFSDCDLVMLFDEDRVVSHEAEAHGQALLRLVQELRSHQAPLAVDLRLRPEGRQGSVAVSKQAFRTYVATRMEPWERMAMSRHRLLFGQADLIKGSIGTVLGQRIEREDLLALLAMKARIEKERVPMGERTRNIKLGPGGQDDILWLGHLWLLARPELRQGGEEELETLLHRLESAGILEPDETEALQGAWRKMIEVRFLLVAQGWKDAVLPSDLDKIANREREAWRERCQDIQAHFTAVRAIFERQRERLISAC